MAYTIGWSLKDAEELVLEIQPILQSLGVSAHIIGSVAKLGQSENDLDILLRPLVPVYFEDVIEGIEKQLLPNISDWKTFTPVESGHRENSWFLPIELRDGRLLEIYLHEVDFLFKLLQS